MSMGLSLATKGVICVGSQVTVVVGQPLKVVCIQNLNIAKTQTTPAKVVEKK